MSVSVFILFVKIVVTLLLHPSPSFSTPPPCPHLCRFHSPPSLFPIFSLFSFYPSHVLSLPLFLPYLSIFEILRSVRIEKKQYKKAVITRECSTSDLQYHSDSDTSKQCIMTHLVPPTGSVWYYRTSVTGDNVYKLDKFGYGYRKHVCCHSSAARI